MKKYIDILEKACSLQRNSPDCLTVSGLFKTLLTQRYQDVQIFACAIESAGKWFTYTTCSDTKNKITTAPIIPFGTISRLVLTSYFKYFVYARLLDMNIKLLEERLIAPLYAAVEAYSSSSRRQRLTCLTAINESFNKCSLIFWLLNLFQTCKCTQIYSAEYYDLIVRFTNTAEADYYSRFNSGFIKQTNRQILELHGQNYPCTEYIVPDILFLAAKDFELSTAFYNIHGYRRCQDCGCLFELRHGRQKHCCACGGSLRHSYNLMRKQQQKVYDYISTALPSDIDGISPVADFFDKDADKQSEIHRLLLRNNLNAQSLDNYIEFLRTAYIKIESYCTLLNFYTQYGDQYPFTPEPF